ncbi:MAG: DNA topoisomerase (ATP-hydrolyzing) subunit A [Clostridia bacterium]|nr:DNA topoisomerase (ATP-hydrolyzing) subunit A [Clostridia bacterium]
MADKKNKKDTTNIPDMPAVEQKITDTLELNYMPYAMSVIVSRAIPEIDGFKPSHRKLLYTMYKMGLINGRRTKSSNVVGATMKLNPHGDMAIYETMVRLARDHEALLHPYVDSKGNFGKHYSRDMQFAAPRYTEVKLEKLCEELFDGIDKDAVDMIDNYDGSMKEPVLLPATFPSVLVNSNQGIAVGMASNVCSFNLEEVCNATIALIKDPQADILDIMPAPDFIGGGNIVYNKEQMRQIYESGKGSIAIRSNYSVDKSSNIIEITQIPYTTSIDLIIDKIIENVKAGKLKEVSDVRDETDKGGLKLAIDCKRGTDHEALMAKLYRYTPLEDSFSCNFNLLINGSPKVLGVYSIINEWINWRRNCVVRQLKFDLDKKKQKLHLLEGLAAILIDIDKAIAIIRNTELEEEVVPNLIKGFGIDEIQAEYVAEIKLRNINKQYIMKRLEEKTKLIEEINDIIDILDKPKRVDNLIIEKLKTVIKKYSQERKSKLIEQENVNTYEPSVEIADYRVRVMLSRHGYLKKHTLVSLRSAGELKVKDDDEIFLDVECNNKSEILFFSNLGNVYKARTYDFNETKPSDYGFYLTNELGLEADEQIVHMEITSDYSGNLMIGFANGKVALFPLNVYETKQNRKKLINAFSSLSPAVSFILLEENKEFDMVARSNLKKAIVFKSSLVPLKSTRTTQGVQLLTSKKGSEMISINYLEKEGLNDPEYYRVRRIPATGYYLKEDAFESRQLTIDGLD